MTDEFEYMRTDETIHEFTQRLIRNHRCVVCHEKMQGRDLISHAARRDPFLVCQECIDRMENAKRNGCLMGGDWWRREPDVPTGYRGPMAQFFEAGKPHRHDLIIHPI